MQTPTQRVIFEAAPGMFVPYLARRGARHDFSRRANAV
jgi:hypothetical protein